MASNVPNVRTRASTALAITGRLPYENLLEESKRMARLRGSNTKNFPGSTPVAGKGKTPVKGDANAKQGSKRAGAGRQKPADASAGATGGVNVARKGIQGATKKPAMRNSASKNGLPNAVDARNSKLARAKRRSNTRQGIARG
jgi:hypothetical protein